jgi:hypothetical protein
MGYAVALGVLFIVFVLAVIIHDKRAEKHNKTDKMIGN